MVPGLILQTWREKFMRGYMGSAERASDPAAGDLGVPSTSGDAEVPSNNAVQCKKCWKNPSRACGLLPGCFVS